MINGLVEKLVLINGMKFKMPLITMKNLKNQKSFIPKFDISLLGVLNSSLTFFLFKEILPKLRGDFYEPSFAYFKDFPVVYDEEGILVDLVNQILSLKKENPSADTSLLEAEIDQLVYILYDLTAEEIAIVEAGVK
jgi:hypothetical protein